MKIHSCILAVLLLSLVSCSRGQDDLKKMEAVMAAYPPELFEQTFVQFLEFARKGDLDGMMKLTSPITIQNQGEAKVRAFYQDHVMNSIKEYPVIAGARDSTFLRDNGNPGWQFKTTLLTNDQQHSVKILAIVIEEEGHRYVAALGPW